MSELQRRIEYIIESDDDTASKAERIAAMIEQRDRHIAKLAQVGMEQEAEVERLRPAAEAWTAVRPIIDLLPTAEREMLLAAARARAAKGTP